MKKDIVAIRGVDEDILRKFRARAIEERMKMGEALNLAMKYWLKERNVTKEKLLKTKSIVKPFDWGKGTEKTSKEIDEILYGNKR